jgi:hypothetical protein
MFSDLRYDPETGLFWWLKRPIRRPVEVMARPVGSIDPRGYRRLQYRGRRYLAHRLAWFIAYGEWPAQIDHITGDKDDNRLSNLRVANAAQNKANSRRPATNTTGYKGVVFHKRQKRWAASIKRGRQRHLGMFDTPEAAHAAYCAAAKAIDGEFFNSG